MLDPRHPVDPLGEEAPPLDLGDALADDGRDLRAGLEEVLAQVHAEHQLLPRQPLVAALQRQNLLGREEGGKFINTYSTLIGNLP